MGILVLDGAVGTELERRGVATAGPAWSARAIREAPEALAEIHRAYAEAGATVHTAATFRTTPRGWGPGWEALAAEAIAITRGAVPAGHRVAGSLAPLEDCWRPERSPPAPGPEHGRIARALADAGADLILCETFPHPGEALAAVDAAVATGLETWLSLTAGPSADLLGPEVARETARRAIEAGAAAVLVNCVPADRTLPYVQALAGLGAPFGAYANGGDPRSWGDSGAAERYLAHARGWVEAGATLVGGCCGTDPACVHALARAFR